MGYVRGLFGNYPDYFGPVGARDEPSVIKEKGQKEYWNARIGPLKEFTHEIVVEPLQFREF